MTKTKSTKRALISSVLALLVCVSMLIGSTFAWFTDTATTGSNVIQSGKLDIVLEYSTDKGETWADAQGKTLNFIAADGHSEILWEPGCTYELPLLRVRNNGNLALKYQIVIDGIDGDAKLLEAIEWTANNAAITTFEGHLDTTNAVSENILIKGHMKEEAGNEYRDLTAKGITITVFATQYTYEKDSYSNKYDENAFYYDVLVTNADELYSAVAAAKGDIVIAIDGNIALTKALSKSGLNSIKFVAMNDGATIDQATYNMHFSGAEVTFDGLTLTHGEKKYGDGGQASTAFAVWNAAEVNYINCTFNRSVGTLHASLHNFIGCTFNGVYNPDNSKSEYPLYICHGKDFNVVDCVFNSTNKGAILFYNDGGTGVDTLNISNTRFLGDIIDDKTAVEIHNNSAEQVYNVNIKDVVVGDGVINGLYRIKPANVGEVNVTVDENTVTYAATASDKNELASAISNAKEGDTVYLNTDVDYGTTQLVVDKDVTIDLNDQELSTANAWGGISLKGGASLKNGTVNHTATVAAVKVTGPVGSIEDVEINATPIAGKVITGIQIVNGGKSVEAIKNVTVTGASQGIEIKDCSPNSVATPVVGVIENVKVDATDVGMIINGYIGKIKDCDIKGANIGINMLLKGEYRVEAELVNCVVTGSKAGIWAHDEVDIPNTNNCVLTLTYDADTVINGGLVWDFKDECSSVVTLNAPSGN